MKFRDEPETPCELQMGPMMDCTFLILLYFISTAQIKLEEKYLGLMVPGNKTATPESLPAELTVAIDEKGNVFCNDVPVGASSDKDLAALQAKLKQVIELFGADKQPVVIHPQPQVRQQRIIDVLAACAAAGVKNLSFFANQ